MTSLLDTHERVISVRPTSTSFGFVSINLIGLISNGCPLQ